MVMRGVSLYLLLGYLLKADASSTCVPVKCLRCNSTEETQSDPCAYCTNNRTHCINASSAIPSNCKKDFQVSVNSTGSNIEEGDSLTLTCIHNLNDLILTFGWRRNTKEIVESRNKSQLFLKKVLTDRAGQYVCFVKSLCGDYESAPHDVTVENKAVVILVICGVSALVLILVIGLAMKFKLKRDNIKHRERLKQKVKAEQRAATPAPP